MIGTTATRHPEPPASDRAALHVCTTCRIAGSPPVDGEIREGARLLALINTLLSDWALRDRITVDGVECMSGCNRSCTLSLSAAGKPSYMFGDLSADAAIAAQALDLAALYNSSDTGILARAERPPLFRSGILARIPPAPLRDYAPDKQIDENLNS